MFIKDKSELKIKFRALFEQAERLIDGGSIDVEVKKHFHKRSKAQNDYYFLICSEIAKFLNRNCPPYGEDELDYDKELIHRINKKKQNVETTTKLSTGDFCDYMTEVIAYWQEKTAYEWMPSELPAMYLANRGYTDDYIRR
jgi:hypothetical protein